MGKLKIITDVDFLRKRSVTVLKEEEESLKHTLLANFNPEEAVGLAAVQLGILKRIFIMKPPWWNEPRFFINPVIHTYGKSVNSMEGCLSFPGITLKCERYSAVAVIQDNKKEIFGNEYPLITEEGFQKMMEAIIVQHEANHLNGELFFDYSLAFSKE